MQDNLTVFPEPPPGNTAQRVTHSLPVSLTSLIGREYEMQALQALLLRPDVRLLTLTGTAGVGKTRLALEVVRDLAHDFADGVQIISLAPLSDPAFVIPTIAHCLGLTESGAQPLLEWLKIFLHDKHSLLLLDNFEHVIEASPLLAELLEVCHGIKLLVTSREVLRLRAEHQFAVSPLALPDPKHLPDDQSLAQVPAVNLFLQRAQAIKADFQLTTENAATIACICVQLDGLPLAIELAAARIKLLPPQALLARLSHRLQVLTSGTRDMPARQQTLRNTIEWSYHLLDAPEQHLFRRLSAFVSGCTLKAAEVVCNSANDLGVEVLEGVASLIDKSLLQPVEQEGEEPRLAMLETIREYGVECLVASGEMEVMHEAHAAYFLYLAETADPESEGPQPAILWGRVAREHDNLRAAMLWLLERKEGTMALRLGCALWWFWLARGLESEGRLFLEHALARSEGIDGAVCAKALYIVGNFAALMGDFDQAKAFCKKSLALFQEMGDRKKVGHVLKHLGFTAYLNKELVAARTYFEESLVIARDVEDKMGIGWALGWLAYLIFYEGEYLRGLTMAEESLAFFQEARNAGAIDQGLWLLAHLNFYAQGNLTEGKARVKESLALAREMNDTECIMDALDLLGQIALHQGKIARAHSLFGEMRLLDEERDNRRRSTIAIRLAQVEAHEGDYTAAHAHYQESLTILKHRHIQNSSMAFALEGLANVVAAQGELVWAAQLWGTAETLRETLRIPIFPIHRAAYESSVAAARSSLGEKAFAIAWADGCAMTPEQTLAARGQMRVLVPPQAWPASASAAKTPNSPAGLTTREMEVLRLLALGLTSAKIAKRLVIGQVTVNSHVRSIYSKLGVTSRAAATRYALEHQLL